MLTRYSYKKYPNHACDSGNREYISTGALTYDEGVSKCEETCREDEGFLLRVSDNACKCVVGNCSSSNNDNIANEYLGVFGGYDFDTVEKASQKMSTRRISAVRKKNMLLRERSKTKTFRTCKTGWTAGSDVGWYSVTGRTGCGEDNMWNSWAPSSKKAAAHCCRAAQNTITDYFKLDTSSTDYVAVEEVAPEKEAGGVLGACNIRG